MVPSLLFDRQTGAGNVTKARNEMCNPEFATTLKVQSKMTNALSEWLYQEIREPRPNPNSSSKSVRKPTRWDVEAIVAPAKLRNSQLLIGKPRSLTLER
jgi:hypothetical protein